MDGITDIFMGVSIALLGNAIILTAAQLLIYGG